MKVNNKNSLRWINHWWLCSRSHIRNVPLKRLDLAHHSPSIRVILHDKLSSYKSSILWHVLPSYVIIWDALPKLLVKVYNKCKLSSVLRTDCCAQGNWRFPTKYWKSKRYVSTDAIPFPNPQTWINWLPLHFLPSCLGRQLCMTPPEEELLIFR